MGRRHASGAFVVIVRAASGPTGRARLGITASRKVGNAVVRNRVKRRVREWFRREGQPLMMDLDAVVIARAGAGGLGGAATFAELNWVAKAIR